MDINFEDECLERILNDPLHAKEMFIYYDLEIPKLSSQNKLEMELKNCVYNAFWDIIDESITEMPNNENLLNLLLAAKNMLLNVAGSRNYSIKTDIETTINIEDISQELTHHNFNLNNRLSLIINIMGKVCSQARDPEIAELREKQDTSVSFLRQLFKVLENMKDDMRNFMLSYYKKSIINNCIKFEKSVFYNCLEKTQVPLMKTYEWLKSATLQVKDENPEVNFDQINENIIEMILSKAYVILLNMNESMYPESVTLDTLRLKSLKVIYNNCIFIATILNILKKQISLLKLDDENIELELAGIALSNIDAQLLDKTDYSTNLSDIAERIISFLDSKASKYGLEHIKQNFKDFFNIKMIQLKNKSDPVWTLFEQRVMSAIFLDQSESTVGNENTDIHFSLISVKESIIHIRQVYYRFIYYNKVVYSDFYLENIKKILNS